MCVSLLFCLRVLRLFVPLSDEGKCEEAVETPLVLWTLQAKRLLRFKTYNKAILVDVEHIEE